jgi:hypothetical protein
MPPHRKCHTKKLVTPDSSRGIKNNNTHKSAMRHPQLPTPPHRGSRPGLLRTACARASTHSNGFCVIRVCISPSSSSNSTRGGCAPLSPHFGLLDIPFLLVATHAWSQLRGGLPTPPPHVLAFCAPHTHLLLLTTTAFVPYGLVLVTV